MAANEGKEEVCYYDVFLSFRGEDTRKTFTDHLYNALVQHGFHTFRDDDEIEKGERLKSELEKAISQSKASILVLSKNYASSTWCLDELVMILERKRNSKHLVLPVFYDVDPSHIRKQKGNTGEAFVKYEAQLEAEIDHELKRKLKENITRWRSALTEVADLIGLNLQDHVDGHEADFIKKIVDLLGDKLRLKTLEVAPYEIGLDSRAKCINMWLQDESRVTSVRFIHGMHGIGKSTIAKFVYNKYHAAFDACSFLANISKVSKRHYSLVRLQRQLLSDICRRKYRRINNIDEGLTHIRKVLSGKRVLLVLDDVDQWDQIYFLLGIQDFHTGSKVIITTMYGSHGTTFLPDDEIFRVEKLDEEESIKLFSLHAFGDDTPIQRYTEYTKWAVKVCEGIPLALEVVGSFLRGESDDEWVSQLAKLEAVPPSKILSERSEDARKTLVDHLCTEIGIIQSEAPLSIGWDMIQGIGIELKEVIEEELEELEELKEELVEKVEEKLEELKEELEEDRSIGIEKIGIALKEELKEAEEEISIACDMIQKKAIEWKEEFEEELEELEEELEEKIEEQLDELKEDLTKVFNFIIDW